MMSNSLNLASNPNTHWSGLFITELVDSGLRHICFAPGSRSTPLVLAAEAIPDVKLYRHLDERSAGYFALGLAKAIRRPVALICTSGTAVANFHPAIIEAHQSRIPLIVLSADRPPELRESGANQTIDQLKLFGDHVRLFMEMPVPMDDAPGLVLRHLRTAAARVFATAAGPVAGPVHVNFPFRKPLEPALGTAPVDIVASNSTHLAEPATPFTVYEKGELRPTKRQVARLVDLILLEREGLIICGPGCPSDSFAAAVAELSRVSGYPVLADPLSGVRRGPQTADAIILGGYDMLLQARASAWPCAKLVIRFGDVPTSAALNAYIGHCAPAQYLHIRSDGTWADDQHLVREFWQVNEEALCREVSHRLASQSPAPDLVEWAQLFEQSEQILWRTVDEFQGEAALYDGLAVSTVWQNLPPSATMLVGNSLPIRHVDAYGRPSPTSVSVHGNRGASGIDGNVSTALGISAAGRGPVVAVLGDITFYHDMNGLLALRQPDVPPVTFVVLNNDGGGIFRRLPIAAIDPPFTELFITPHGLTFEHVAALYGMTYQRIDHKSNLASLSDHLRELRGPNWDTHQSSLFEVMTDGCTDHELHLRLIEQIATALPLASTRNTN